MREGVTENEGDVVLLSEEEAWKAVVERDERFDGTFVYAVETTGIYCRPSCPARRPSRRNVQFVKSPSQAERRGFRACLRCRPNRQHSSTEEAVESARRYLDEHLDGRPSLDELASHVDLSPSYLQRVFRRSVGMSPKEYHNLRRLERFKQNVGPDCDVLEATYEAGFGSSRALYEQAKNGLGMTPGAYRRGGKGMTIRYTIVRSTLGVVLVGATESGVCSVSLGDAEDELFSDLEEEFFNAGTFIRDDGALRRWSEPIVRYLEGVHSHPSVPVDVCGTDFQRQVWRLLQEIPYGETRSYGELAAMLGRPKSARAVARACATNNVALVIPCHRVVRKDGDPGGYKWGDDRKRQLLELEHAAPTDGRSQS